MTAFVWGFLAILIKVATLDVSPVTIAWVRFSVAFFILSSWFLFKNRPGFKMLIHPPLLLILAAISLTLNYLGYATGIDLTTPANGQIFIQFGPFLLAIAGLLIYKETLSIRQFLGFIIAGGGFYLFYHDQLGQMFASENIYMKGVSWLIFAATAWALFSVLQKGLVQQYPAQQLNLFVFGFPTMILLPFIPFGEFLGLHWPTWILLLFLGINTVVAYGCLAEAFRFVEANKVSVIITLNPIITFILLAIFDSMNVSWIEAEVLTFYGILGAGLVVLGAILVVLPKKLKGMKKQGNGI
jgi:drug/metabolite transporter (DMT)-like permease